MFGADTPLVMDALQIAALAAAVGAGAVVLMLRRRRRPSSSAVSLHTGRDQTGACTLEERVRVLERIATDRPADLAEEIEALRDASRSTQTASLETGPRMQTEGKPR